MNTYKRCWSHKHVGYQRTLTNYCKPDHHASSSASITGGTGERSPKYGVQGQYYRCPPSKFLLVMLCAFMQHTFWYNAGIAFSLKSEAYTIKLAYLLIQCYNSLFTQVWGLQYQTRIQYAYLLIQCYNSLFI